MNDHNTENQDVDTENVKFEDMDDLNVESPKSPDEQLIEPTVGMQFDTFDEAFNFYNSYAFKKGFSVRRDRIHMKGGVKVSQRFVCVKEGKKRYDKQRANATFSRAQTRSPSFKTDFNRCIYEYEDDDNLCKGWKKMLDDHDLRDNRWLESLFWKRKKWAMVHGRRIFSAGMNTTQRSESFNSLARHYVTSKLDPIHFLEHFQRVVEDRRYSETIEEFRTTNNTPEVMVKCEMLKAVVTVYMPTIFCIFEDQFESSIFQVLTLKRDDGCIRVYEVGSSKGAWHTVMYDSLEGAPPWYEYAFEAVHECTPLWSNNGNRSQTKRSLRPNVFSCANTPTPSRTQRIMESISTRSEVGGAGGVHSYNALRRLDQLWCSLCSTEPENEEYHQIVSNVPGPFNNSNSVRIPENTFDVVVCGGTLGIFVATALSSKGLQVGIVERNLLKGREQEWNISMKELRELVEVGVLAESDIQEVISMKFNPNRCGFEGKGDIWVKDILNLGVSPAKLVEVMKMHFISLGGVIIEGVSLSNISVYDDTALLQLSNGMLLQSRLVIDAMGNFSPVVKQIRSGKRPDGVCLVVGSCSRGFKDNQTSDIIFSSSSVRTLRDSKVHYFWEAFPAGSGLSDRTTYMFTYVEAKPGSPMLEELFEDYWELMPSYQGVTLDDLEVLRVNFGIFPTYRDSPLHSDYNRILQIGDASGIQSPVSFGGFGSMTRHLGRLSFAIYEAAMGNFVDSGSLSLINPYMPNLSASWLFQRAMSARSDSNVSDTFINDLLYTNFECMQRLGDPVLRPFLQDVIQFVPLVKTLGSVMLVQPQILPSIFRQVGIGVLLDWSVHFFMLGYYTLLSTYMDPVVRPLVNYLPERMKYNWRRYLEAWKYGSGLDYKDSYHTPSRK
ncbi:hypothetical protein H6P81_020044 [Aristolochia fimbriata]|uniref:FAR1 domain-containing protein n=1 Tax=Aristolochia fimbriata TaxID=158543 RepID=A0AAV7DTN6_ARIFI|nr:hypothetical protein H6P81_020044 [Aristolochia fimbriata]